MTGFIVFVGGVVVHCSQIQYPIVPIVLAYSSYCSCLFFLTVSDLFLLKFKINWYAFIINQSKMADNVDVIQICSSTLMNFRRLGWGWEQYPHCLENNESKTSQGKSGWAVGKLTLTRVNGFQRWRHQNMLVKGDGSNPRWLPTVSLSKYPFVSGRRDYHFRIPRTKYGLGVDFRWNRAFFNFGEVGRVGVVIGRRDHHFRCPYTEFSLGTDFRWKPSFFFLVPLPWQIRVILPLDSTTC